MKPTQIALAGRILQSLSKLHPPSGPTVRESNALLRTLQTSFQKELDTNHPDPKANHVRESVGLLSSGFGESNLKDMNDQLWTTLAVGMNPAATNKQRLAIKLEEILDRPDVSLIDLDALLQLHLTTIKKESSKSEHDPIYDRLDRWLWNADMSVRKAFFTSDCLHTAMRTFLYQTNETMVWKWLNAVYQRQSIDVPVTTKKWLFVEDVMVSTLMRMAKSAKRLDDAATQLVFASQYRFDSGRIPVPEQITKQVSPGLLQLSSRVLCQGILQAGPSHGISAETFDKVLQVLQPGGPISALERDFCAVYHPESVRYQGLFSGLQDSVNAESLFKAKSTYSSHLLTLWTKSLKAAAEAALEDAQPKQASCLLNTALDLGLANHHFVQVLRTAIREALAGSKSTRFPLQRVSFSSLQLSSKSIHTTAAQLVPDGT